MVEIVSVIGAAWVICSVGSIEVSYPHYIIRVYGTKVGPYRVEIRVVVIMLLL